MRRGCEEASKQVDFSPQTDTFHSFGQLFQRCMLYFSSWANVYQILINYFLFLLKFDSTSFMYHSKTFRWHVSFSISQRLVSVKNKLLQCIVETSQFIFQFAWCVRRLWFLRTYQKQVSLQILADINMTSCFGCNNFCTTNQYCHTSTTLRPPSEFVIYHKGFQSFLQ